MRPGKVYLVGAGPGDPGLITVKGLECLARADVILYDHLLNTSLLDSARPEAEKIYVGKTGKRHSMEQAEINRLLVEKAQAGKTVVRLKGGDPFVLGRGGEEAEVLAQHGIPFEVVSGVTSAIAVPAYAGIPLTHRKLASSFAVVTGHEAPDKDEAGVAWEKLGTAVDTLVLLMGVGNLATIVEELTAGGMDPSTPIALIRCGTTHEQRTLVGSLGDIVEQAEKDDIHPPAVIVIGEVVRLREKLRWFDSQPLFGQQVLITRARHQAGALSRLLLERGAFPVEMPVIQVGPSPSTEELDGAILHLKEYHWVVFTSVNGVEAFCRRLRALGLDVRHFGEVRIGAIGSATAEALERWKLRPDYVPEEYTSQGFVAGLGEQQVRGLRFLLPRAEIASPELAEGLKDLGAEVHQVTAYRTTPAAETDSPGRKALLAGEIDIVTFTSSSTVNGLVALLGPEWPAINRARVACIGPVTARAAARVGLRVDIVAQKHTVAGLVEAIEAYLENARKEER